MIRKGIDVKLNVKPVFVGLVHKHVYEGSCRFGKDDELTPEYDAMLSHELSKSFFEDADTKLCKDTVNLLEPVYLERDDRWLHQEEDFLKMAEDEPNVDLYFFSFGIARGDIFIEFVQRVKKPVALVPGACCEATLNTCAIRNRGYECYAYLTWDEMNRHLRALRTRKVLKETRVLLAPRMNSNRAYSSTDNFICIEDLTEKFGIQFRYINAHELMDMSQPCGEAGNPTLPGRKAYNIDDDDIKEIYKITDELIAGAEMNTMERDMIASSVRAHYTVKKLIEVYDCNAFSIPCPDVCSTRRLNEEKYTFCLNHSLLNEQAIPSACEYDLCSLLSLIIISNLTGKAPYMGNTTPVTLEDGKMVSQLWFNEDDLEGVKDIENLYLHFHAVPNRKMKGFKEEESPYGITPFAHSGFGATLRHDFSRNIGETITMCRFAPDAKRLFVGQGTIVKGVGYAKNSCTEGLYFRVADQSDFFYKQMNFGNHTSMVFGDYAKDLQLLGEAIGIEVVVA